MIKTKMLMVLAAMAATFIVSVAPASALFESDSASTTGPIVTFPETSTFVSDTGDPPVECKTSEAPAGEWEIYSAAGAPAKSGPTEQLKIKKWGHCTGPTLLAAKVSCSLLVEQPVKNTTKPQTGTGGVEPGCQVGFGSCIVTVASQTNRGLKEVKLENIGTEEVGIGSEVSGITSTVTAGCTSLGVKGGKVGTFKTKNNLITKGQKLI